MIEGLRRADIERLTIKVLRPPLDARPDVRLVDYEGTRVVVKDYATGGTRFKSALGTYLVGREHHALSCVNGISGIPHYYGRIDAYALVTEYVESVAVTEAPAGTLTPDFFAELEHIVEQVHARGVVHCDLKKLDNILVDADGAPHVIDFTAAFVTGSNPLTGLIFDQMRDDDLRGIYKLKRRYAPELLTPNESLFLDFRSAPEKGFRAVREGVREAIQRWSGGRGHGAPEARAGR